MTDPAPLPIRVVIDDVNTAVTPYRCQITADGLSLVAFAPYTQARIEAYDMPVVLRWRALAVTIAGNARSGRIQPIVELSRSEDRSRYYLSAGDVRVLVEKRHDAGALSDAMRLAAERVVTALVAADAALAQCDIARTAPTSNPPTTLTGNIALGGAIPGDIRVESVDWNGKQINGLCLDGEIFWLVHQIGKAIGFTTAAEVRRFRINLRQLPPASVYVLCSPALQRVYRWMRAREIIGSAVMAPTTAMVLSHDGLRRALTMSDRAEARLLLDRTEEVARLLSTVTSPAVTSPSAAAPAAAVDPLFVAAPPPITKDASMPSATVLSSLDQDFAVALPRPPGHDYQLLRVGGRRYVIFDDEPTVPRLGRSVLPGVLSRSSNEIRRAIREVGVAAKRTAHVASNTDLEACFTAREIRMIADRLRVGMHNPTVSRVRGEFGTFARVLGTPPGAMWDAPGVVAVPTTPATSAVPIETPVTPMPVITVPDRILDLMADVEKRVEKVETTVAGVVGRLARLTLVESRSAGASIATPPSTDAPTPGCLNGAVALNHDGVRMLASDTIAAALGVPHATIVTMADDLTASGDIRALARGIDGRWITVDDMPCLLIYVGGRAAARLSKMLTALT